MDFSERIAAELSLPTIVVITADRDFQLPQDPASVADYLLLVPKDVLRDLPTAFSWEDIDIVCAHNAALRAKMNQLIGETWRQAIVALKKEQLRDALIKNPDAMRDLLEQYRGKPLQPYDFRRDVLGEMLWPETGQLFASQYPLTLPKVTADNVEETVRKICEQFRKLVEDNGLSRLFWADDGSLRHERFAQLLYFAVADCYCRASNVDLSPECDSGRGPVDFKISSGYEVRVLVEVKWSTNTRLRHGYERQLEEYGKAESTDRKIFLILQVGDSTASIEAVQGLRAKAIRDGNNAPSVVVADARVKDSASKH